MAFFVATTSLPAVDRPNADRCNAARSCQYQEKLVQGKKIYQLVGEGVVSYKASPYELKEEFDLYMENQEDFREVENVKLKPWQ